MQAGAYHRWLKQVNNMAVWRANTLTDVRSLMWRISWRHFEAPPPPQPPGVVIITRRRRTGRAGSAPSLSPRRQGHLGPRRWSPDRSPTDAQWTVTVSRDAFDRPAEMHGRTATHPVPSRPRWPTCALSSGRWNGNAPAIRRSRWLCRDEIHYHIAIRRRKPKSLPAA